MNSNTEFWYMIFTENQTLKISFVKLFVNLFNVHYYPNPTYAYIFDEVIIKSFGHYGLIKKLTRLCNFAHRHTYRDKIF